MFNCTLIFSLGEVELSGSWCWIARSNLALRLLCLYAWVYLTFLFIIVSYAVIIKRLFDMQKNTKLRLVKDSRLSIFARMAAYPIIFFCCLITVGCLRMAESVSDYEVQESEPLLIVQDLCFLEGCLASLVFTWLENLPCAVASQYFVRMRKLSSVNRAAEMVSASSSADCPQKRQQSAERKKEIMFQQHDFDYGMSPETPEMAAVGDNALSVSVNDKGPL